MKNFVILVVVPLCIFHCKALTIKHEENYQPVDRRYVYSENDEPSEDIGTVEYYKPPSRHTRIPSSKYDDPAELNNEDLNYPPGYQIVPTTENYPYEVSDYNQAATKRIRTTKKPVMIEQFLKEVTPTTKIAYQQYAKLNNQRRRIDNIRDQIEENHANDVKEIPQYQYVVPGGLQQRSSIPQSPYSYEIPESKSVPPQQNSEHARPQYAIIPNRTPSHQKIVQIDPNQHSSQSSIYVSTSLPTKPVRKIVKPKASPVDEDVAYYSQLQQYQQQLQLKQQLRQRQQQQQRSKQRQIQQQQERRQKIQQQLVQEQQLLQQQILRKQIQQQRLQEADFQQKVELQQSAEVKYQTEPQQYPKEDTNTNTRDQEDYRYYQPQPGQYEIDYKPGTSEVTQYQRNPQIQRKPELKNIKQAPVLSTYSEQEPWKPMFSKNIPGTKNYYYQPSTVESPEPNQESTSLQQHELPSTKLISYQKTNVQELDKYHQQTPLRQSAKIIQEPKSASYQDVTVDPQIIQTKAIQYQLSEPQDQSYEVIPSAASPDYDANVKNVQPKRVIYSSHNENDRDALYEQSLIKYQKNRIVARERPQLSQQPEQNQQEILEVQYFKPHELSNFKSNDQENFSFKPNLRNDARLYRNLRPTASYEDRY